jgi:ABC-type transport system involved in multi-copper enzyme maturation permease subunit
MNSKTANKELTIAKRLLNGSLATCSFELRRSFTFQRTAVSVVLALFPPVMLGLLIIGTEMSGAAQARSVVQDFAKLLTVLLVSLVCLLSLLLWATPNVYSELEGKSWSFIASRPGGRISVFLGKFLAAFVVSFTISVIAISMCVLLAKTRLGIENAQSLWLSLCGIYFFGCCVYGAVFSLIGTYFIKRAMVVAAGYLIGSDLILASIPGAVINKLTIRYHLQEIGIGWMGWFFPAPSTEADYRQVFGEAFPIWMHVAIVTGITVFALGFGTWVIVNREYITSDQT